MRSSDEDRAGAVADAGRGRRGAQLGRRPLIKYTLGGALGLFALPLGPAAGRRPRPAAGRRALAHHVAARRSG